MDNFDVNEFFRRKQESQNAAQFNNPSFGAVSRLEQRAEKKKQELQEKQENELRALNELSRRKKENESSLVNQLGLDTRDVTGQAVNTAASLGSGVGITAGAIGSALPDLATVTLDDAFNEDVEAAFARFQNNEATPEDLELLNTPQKEFRRENKKLSRGGPNQSSVLDDTDNGSDATVFDVLENRESIRDFSKDVTEATDFSSIVDDTNRRDLSRKIDEASNSGLESLSASKEAFEDGEIGESIKEGVSGLASLLWNVPQEVVSNPSAVSEFVAENVPQLVAGAKSKALLTADVVGFSTTAYQRGIEKFKSENNGRIPDSETRKTMAMNAAAGAAAEFVGTEAILRGIRGARGQTPQTSTADGTLARTGNTARATGGAAVTEGTTEGIQTVTEGNASLTPATGAEIIEGISIGSATGAGLTGPGRAVNEFSGQGEGAQERNRQDKEQVDSVQKAAETGDIDQFIKEGNPNESRPDLAISALALRNRNIRASVENTNSESGSETGEQSETPAELTKEQTQEIKANEERIQQLLTEAQNEETALKKEQSLATEEGGQQERERIDALIQERDNLSDTEADQTRREKLDAQIPILEERLADAQDNPDRATDKAVQNQINQAEKNTQNARKAFQAVQDLESAETSEQTADLVQEVQQPSEDTTPEQQQESARKLVRSAMANPDALSVDDASALADDTSNGLNDNERDFLRSFTESRLQENLSKDSSQVRKDINEGSDGFKGVKDFRTDLSVSLNQNDRDRAAEQVADIKRFAQSQRSKSNAIKAAQQAVQQNGGSVDVVRDANDPTGFRTRASQGTKRSLRNSGGLRIDQNSGALAQNIEAEADILERNAQEMQDAFNTKFEGEVGDPVSAAQPANSQSSTESSRRAQQDVEADAQAGTQSTETTEASVNETSQEATTGQSNTGAETSQAATQSNQAATNTTNATEVDNNAGSTQSTSQIDNSTNNNQTQASIDTTANTQETNQEVTDSTQQETTTNETTEETTQEASQETATSEGTSTTTTESDSNTSEVTSQEQEEQQQESAEEAGRRETAQAQSREASTLAVFDNTVERIIGIASKTLFETINPVVHYLKQKTPKQAESRKTASPLVMEKDFVSNVLSMEGPEAIQHLRSYLENDPSLTDEQKKQQIKAFREFLRKTRKWNKKLTDELPKKKDKFLSDDMIHGFMDENGDIDENIKTAISYAVFSYLAENAGNSYANTEENINSILNRDDEAVVTQNEWDTFGKFSVGDKSLANNLGQRIVSSLGISQYSDAPNNTLNQFTAQIGMRALQLMESEGLLETENIRLFPTETSALTVSQAEASGPGVQVRMARIRREWQSSERFPPLDGGAQDVLNASSNSKGAIDKLFKTEKFKPSANLAPLKYTQVTTKGTNQNVASPLANILKGENKKPWKIRQDGNLLLRSMLAHDRAIIERIGGGQNLETGVVHKANRDSIDSKNQGLAREAAIAEQFLDQLADSEQGLDSPIYLDHDVKRQNRVHLHSSDMDPQASKLHRMLMTRNSWSFKVNLNNNDGSLTQFNLAVAESLGIKTDEMSNEKALKQLDKKIKTPAIKNAVEALVLQQNGVELSQEQFDAIEAGVEEGGEDFHSLDGLLSLAKKEITRQTTGVGSFETQLGREVDGKTNGPMLAYLQLASAQSPEAMMSILNRGGFFENGSDFEQFFDWRSQQGNEDLYESLIRKVDEAMKHNATPETQRLNKLVTDTLGGLLKSEEQDAQVASSARKLVKRPIQSMVFGSSKQNAIDKIADDFIQNIYDRIVDLNKRDDLTEQELAKVTKNTVKRINAMLSAGNSQKLIPVNATREQLLETVFNDEQTQALKNTFNRTIGERIDEVIEQEHGSFLALRNTMNKSTSAAFELYNIAFETLRQQELARLTKTGDIATKKNPNTGVVEPLQDLPKENIDAIRERLKDMEPVVHSAFSAMEGNLDAGLSLSKQEQQSSQKLFHAGEVKWASKLNSSTKGTGSQYRSRAFVPSTQPAGVGAFVTALHSSESAIGAFSYTNFEGLNVHDAAVWGIGFTEQGAREQNKQTFQVQSEFSVPMEMFNSLQRTIEGFHDLMTQFEDTSELAESYRKVMQGLYDNLPKDVRKSMNPQDNMLRFMVNETFQAARESRRNQLEIMGNLKSVDQFSMENGQYTVTDKDRQNIQRMQEELELRDISELLQQVDALEIMMRDNGKSVNKHIRRKTPNGSRDFATVDSAYKSVLSASTQTEVAAALKNLIGEQRSKLTEKSQKGEQLTNKEREGFRKAQKIAQAYAQTGDLMQAINRVLPNETQSHRNQWFERVELALKGRKPDVRAIETAPRVTALNLLRQITNRTDIDDQTRQALESTAQDMRDNGRTLRQSLRENGDVDVLMRSKVLATLNRFYNSNRQSPWGELGDSLGNNDAGLVEFLENTPNPKAWELIRKMEETIKSQPNSSSKTFYLGLLRQLREKGDGQIPVRYLTEDSANVLDPPDTERRSKGWFESGENDVITIRSPEFVESGVNNELLMHELTHSVLDRLIVDVQDGNIKDKNLQELVQELETLLERAQEKVNSDASLTNKYGPAVENVRELLAWGMTNEGFQNEVLNEVEMESANTENPLVTGMRRFIDVLRRMLFGNSNKTQAEQQNTGMAVLLTNASGLFQGVANRKDSERTGSITSRQQNPDSLNETQQFTTEEIYDGLGSASTDGPILDKAYDRHLRGLLQNVVNRVHGAFGTLKQDVEHDTQAFSPEDVYLNAEKTGRLPFSSKIFAQPFRITEQEAFVIEQVEATVKATLESGSATNQELKKLYNETKQRLNPEDFHDGDWATATQTERDLAQAQYDFIFRPDTSVDGTTEYLSRFMALGLAYKPLNDLMNAPTAITRTSLKDMTFAEKLNFLFARFMDAIDQRGANVFEGQQADEKMRVLMENLVSIESRNRANLARSRTSNFLDRMDGHLKARGQQSREQIEKLASSKVFQNSKSSVVRAFGKATSTVAGERVTHVIEGINRSRGLNRENRESFLTSLINEAKGPTDDAGVTGHQLLRMTKKNEQEVQRIKEAVSETLMESFDDNGKYLTVDDKKALTQIMMRGDMVTLTQHFSQDQLANMLDPSRRDKELNQAIKDFEQQLQKFTKDQHYYREAAEQLGYKLATDINSGPAVMQNARNIASGSLTSRETLISEEQRQEAEPIIDALASLYAMKYNDTVDRQRATNAMRRENQRGTESGVSMMLELHRQFQQESLERLFQNNPTQMQKGYTKEIYNPYKQMTTANAVDGAELEKKGWKKVEGSDLAQDPQDDNAKGQKAIYTVRDGGKQQWVTASLGYQGEHAMGSTLHSGETLSDGKGVNPINHKVNVKVANQKRQELDKMFQPGRKFDPEQASKNNQFMSPILDAQGKAVNWRYIMSKENKNTILERNNQMEEVMGAMAGSLFNKESSKDQNQKVIDALHEQWQAEALTKPNAFVTVSPDSSDPELQEMWRLLPEDTKKAARKRFGKNQIKVRSDLLNMTFGYRKFSISDMYSKESQERNVMEKFVVTVTEDIFGKKTALKVRQSENIIQAAIQEMKDIIVIKNVTTFLGNMASNVTELLWMGLTPSEIVRHHVTAVRATRDYQRKSKEWKKLNQLVQSRNLQGSNLQDVQDRMTIIEQELQNNPVRELVDAGMFQTIVEDVANHDDEYSYRSLAVRQVGKLTDPLPESVKTVGKWIYMSHDTPLYQFMNQATFMSDFAARFALHQHQTTREDNTMSREESLQFASEAFVNFDIPTHKGLQYMNDMGLIWFTKYYIRIQKILLGLMKERPARGLSLVAFNAMAPGVPTLADSAATVGNPISDSVLSYGEAVEELPAVKLGMGFFQ